MQEDFLEIAEKGYVNVSRLDRNLEEGTYSKLAVSDIDIDYMLGLKKTPSNPFVLAKPMTLFLWLLQ